MTHTAAPRMTPTQEMAIAELRKLTTGRWQRWGSGMGKYNVALRALMLRAPSLIECRGHETGEEWWRIKE